MARERGLEFKVGLLILISAAILVGFIFVLGNFSLRSGFEVHVDFDYVGSLRAGAPVKVSGIKVGRATRLSSSAAPSIRRSNSAFRSGAPPGSRAGCAAASAGIGRGSGGERV